MTTMTIPRMFTDEAGESRFDSYKAPLTLHEHAPSDELSFLSYSAGVGRSAASDTGLPVSDLLVRRPEVHWEYW
jgi:hypothetical protein